MPIVTTSSRGQVVIPKEIRKQMQIVPGKKLSIKVENDHICLTPLPDDPVDYFCGIFQEKTSLTRALIDHRRKEKDRE